MATIKKLRLIFAILVPAGFLGFFTWQQWSDNQTTILERMEPIPPLATYTEGGSIDYIAFDPKNPELIASARSGNIVKIWNLKRQDAPVVTLKTDKEQDREPFFIGLGFSPIDNWIATKTFWTLEFWDSTSGSKINTLHTTSSNFAISSVGNRIALKESNLGLTLLDVNDPKNIKGKILLPPRMDWEAISLGLEKIVPYPEENVKLYTKLIDYSNAFGSDQYKEIDFSHDARWLAAAGKILIKNRQWQQKVKIWDLQKNQLYKIIDREESKLQESKDKEENVPANTPSTSNDVQSITFSPDNRFFGLAADNGLTIWSLPEWDIYHEVLDQKIADLAFSPNGKVYAITDRKKVILSSVDDLMPIALLKGKEFMSYVDTLEFSQDGKFLAAAGWSGILWIWNVSELYEN